MPNRKNIPLIDGSLAHGTAEPGSYFHGERVAFAGAEPRRLDLHRHPYFELFWFTAGRGVYHSDFTPYQVRADMLAFSTVGQVHQWSSGEGLEANMVSFGPEDLGPPEEAAALLAELSLFFDPGAGPVMEVPDVADRGRFTRLFAGLLEELEGDHAMHREAARSILKLILIRAQRLHLARGGRHQRGAATALARAFMLELERSFLKLRRVQDYAARLQVTPNHLVETIREQMGRTPGELLDERLFLEARRLLFHTSRSVSEIAYLLEFKNPSHFGRFFKRHDGRSPGQAREEFHRTGQSRAA